MIREQSGSNDDSLRTDLQALVTQLKLVTGELELVVHEGSIPHINVKAEYRVDVNPRDRGNQTEAGNQTLRLSIVKSFVRSRLERPSVDRIGRFGNVRLQVKDGKVLDSHFEQRYRHTG